MSDELETVEQIWGDDFVLVRRRLPKGAFGGMIDQIEDDLWDTYGRRELENEAQEDYWRPDNPGLIETTVAETKLSFKEFLRSFWRIEKGTVTVEWVVVFSGTFLLLTILLGILYPPLVEAANAQALSNANAVQLLTEINDTGCFGLMP